MTIKFVLILNSVSRFVYLFINITLYEGAKQDNHIELYDHSSIARQTTDNKISAKAISGNLNFRPKRTLTRYRINGKLLKYVLSNPKCKPLHLSSSAAALNSKMLTRLVTSPYGIIMLTSKDESRYVKEKPQIKANLQPVNRMEESNAKIDGKFGKYRNVIRRTQRNQSDYDDQKNEYFLRFRRGGRKLIIICAKSSRS